MVPSTMLVIHSVSCNEGHNVQGRADDLVIVIKRKETTGFYQIVCKEHLILLAIGA